MRRDGWCRRARGSRVPAQCTALWQSGQVQYVYDGDGKRLQKVGTSGTATTYGYDASGALMGEYGGAGGNATTQYMVADALGSTRMILDSAGCPQQRLDYLPYGAQISGALNWRAGVSDSCNTAHPGTYQDELGIPQKFTGKERDTETGLDYFGARYFSGAQGRFTSPDRPFADENVGDPQSWNLYSYVRNNPLRFTDPTGAYIEAKPSDQRSSGGDYREAPCGVNLKDCGPQFAALPQTTSMGQTKDRALGVAKGFLTDVFEVARLIGAPDSNVNQLEDLLHLEPTSKNEEFGITLAGIFGVLLPSGGGRDLVKTWELISTHELTMSNRQFRLLKESIREGGMKEAIKFVEYEGKKFIVDGNHRVEAARQLGIREVPAQRVTLPYRGYKTPADLH